MIELCTLKAPFSEVGDSNAIYRKVMERARPRELDMI